MNKRMLFIQEDVFPKLGTMYVSSIFRRHHWQVDCLITSQEKNLAQKIQELSPAIVGLSLTSNEYAAWGSHVAQLVKQNAPHSLVMLGGPHATYFPQVIEDDGIDMVCIGEGETPVETFCERWERGEAFDNIAGIWAKAEGHITKNDVSSLINNLESIDFPDRKLYQRYPFVSQLSYAFVTSSRGCPYQCSFCHNYAFLKIFKGKGAIFRRRPVDDIIKEIQELRQLFPSIKSICFPDDNFWYDIPKDWLSEFSSKYKDQVGLPFLCGGSAHWISEKTVALLKEANCAAVKIAIESANQRVRQEVLKKYTTNDEIYKAAALLHKYKINFLTFNMLGIPTENYQNALDTYEMNRQIRPLFSWCSLLNPYKGTPIYDMAKKQGLLPESFEFSPSYFQHTPLQFDSKADIIRLQKFFPVGVLLNIPTRWASWITRNIRINFIYNLLFILFYSLLIGKINLFSRRDIVILATHTSILKYFGFVKHNLKPR